PRSGPGVAATGAGDPPTACFPDPSFPHLNIIGYTNKCSNRSGNLLHPVRGNIERGSSAGNTGDKGWEITFSVLPAPTGREGGNPAEAVGGDSLPFSAGCRRCGRNPDGTATSRRRRVPRPIDPVPTGRPSRRVVGGSNGRPIG